MQRVRLEGNRARVTHEQLISSRVQIINILKAPVHCKCFVIARIIHKREKKNTAHRNVIEQN